MNNNWITHFQEIPYSQSDVGIPAPTNSTYSDDPNNAFGKIGCGVSIATSIVGFIGNALVLEAIGKVRNLKNSYNTYVFMMSVSDLLSTAFILPHFAYSYLHRSWALGYDWCRFITYFASFLQCFSSMTMGCIAINRAFLIVLPHKTTINSVKTRIAKTFIVFFVSFSIVVLPHVSGSGKIGYDDQIGRCGWIHRSSRLNIILICCVGIVLPWLLICVCYTLILIKLNRQKKRIHNSHIETIANRLIRDRYKTPTRLISVIFASYVLIYLPFAIVNLSDVYASFSRTVYIPVNTLSMIGTSLNPFIYGIIHKQFRRAYVEVLYYHCGDFEKKPPVRVTDLSNSDTNDNKLKKSTVFKTNG